jgi:AcrR family transcriptional regulator
MRTASNKPAASSPDGRVQRGERSRKAIVTALFELIAEGVYEPTADQVAERAAVGIRSVFRHFSDMYGLYTAMDARIEEACAPFVIAPVPKGTLHRRGRAFVERRATLYEQIAPYKRAANAKRAHSEVLQDLHVSLVRRSAKDLHRWFPELGKAKPEVVHALELATSFEAWDRLRVEQRLGKQRAAAAMQCTVAALFRNL